MNVHVLEIRDLAKRYNIQPNVFPLIERVLGMPEFSTWSGAARPEHHHYGDGGLARHTYEVIKLCMLNRDALSKMEMDKEELFLAALYHDVGKLYDYEKFEGVWQGTSHKRMIHHISRSAITWSHVWRDFEMTTPGIPVNYHDPVLHAILAHHGSRQYGSPVAPKSQVAWMLHLCDSVSARMDDWNKMDVVDKDKGKV
jgi:3'-5' exoribonuclease